MLGLHNCTENSLCFVLCQFSFSPVQQVVFFLVCFCFGFWVCLFVCLFFVCLFLWGRGYAKKTLLINFCTWQKTVTSSTGSMPETFKLWVIFLILPTTNSFQLFSLLFFALSVPHMCFYTSLNQGIINLSTGLGNCHAFMDGSDQS